MTGVDFDVLVQVLFVGQQHFDDVALRRGVSLDRIGLGLVPALHQQLLQLHLQLLDLLLLCRFLWIVAQ